MMQKSCKSCEYWLEKLEQCEHPEQYITYKAGHSCPEDYGCELYECARSTYDKYGDFANRRAKL